MNFKSCCTGVQHIGIPTDNIEKTVSFFWEKGIKYFIIEGPNKERLEVCQKL